MAKADVYWYQSFKKRQDAENTGAYIFYTADVDDYVVEKKGLNKFVIRLIQYG